MICFDMKEYKRKNFLDERELYAYIAAVDPSAPGEPNVAGNTFLFGAIGGLLTIASAVNNTTVSKLPKSFLMTIYDKSIFISEEYEQGKFKLPNKPYQLDDFKVEGKDASNPYIGYVVSVRWGGGRVNFNFSPRYGFKTEFYRIINFLPARPKDSKGDNLDKLKGFSWSVEE